MHGDFDIRGAPVAKWMLQKSTPGRVGTWGGKGNDRGFVPEDELEFLAATPTGGNYLKVGQCS
jgi:hypothetical protein